MSKRPTSKAKGGHRTCEICGINERKVTGSVFFASFPTDEKRCKEWLRVTGKEDLVYLPIEKLHQLKNICGAHFHKKDFGKKGNRLKYKAIPSQNLTAKPLTPEQLVPFPMHMWNFKREHSKEQEPSTSKATPSVHFTSQLKPMPSTSHEQKEIVPVVQIMSEHSKEQEPSTSKATPSPSVHFTSQLKPMPSTSHEQKEIVPVVQIMSDLTNKLDRNEAEFSTQSSDKRLLSKKGVKRSSEQDLELTPRKKKLVAELQRTKCTLKSLRSSCILLENIESPALKELVINLVKNRRKKPKGRRWTIKHKLSSLSIYKRSPRSYRHLVEIGKGAFPSEKTLQNILKKIPMQPGINNATLNYLKSIAPKKNVKNKQCCLLFDEMAIKPRLIYNAANDVVEGFEDYGQEFERTPELADHALVFMLQGLYQKFKQPIAFFFVKGTISSSKLSVLIKRIINNVNSTGFNVVNTVCDQGPTNIGALKLLRESSRADSNNYFTVEGQKVFIIYDVPHLFKSIRNNFLNNGVVTLNGKKSLWSHILKVEEKNRNFLYFSKIKPVHVNLKYRSKMKVKYAAQILSNTVHAVLKMMSDVEKERNEAYANELLESALVIKEFDSLFDATNGPSGSDDVKPRQRISCSDSSNHINIWNEWIKKIETLKFGEAKNIKCISGYIITLKSLKDIWNYLRGIGFTYFNQRQVNQDALENLFGVIRQHSPTNKNPTCTHFMAALKTAVVTNMTAHHSRGSNCERDKQDLLTNFHSTIFDETEKENTMEFNTETEESEVPVISIPDQEEIDIEDKLGDIHLQPVVYISGFLAYKIFKTHRCSECRKNLCEDMPNPSIHMYITLREWWPEKLSLKYPTLPLCSLVQKAVEITEQEICTKLHEKNICELAITLYTAVCDITWFTCTNHKNQIFKKLYKSLSSLLIRRQCQRINQGLALEEEIVVSTQKKAQQYGVPK